MILWTQLSLQENRRGYNSNCSRPTLIKSIPTMIIPKLTARGQSMFYSYFPATAAFSPPCFQHSLFLCSHHCQVLEVSMTSSEPKQKRACGAKGWMTQICNYIMEESKPPVWQIAAPVVTTNSCSVLQSSMHNEVDSSGAKGQLRQNMLKR